MDGHLQQIGENAKKCSVILNLSLWWVMWRAVMCFRLISTSHQDWALPHTISHIYTGLSLLYISFSIHNYTGLSLTHIPLRCALSCLNNRDTLHLPSGAVYAHIQPAHTEELYDAW